MIQDIFPHKFNNQFKEGALLTKDSRVMLFCKGKLLVIEETEDERDCISFPLYKDLADKLPDLTYFFQLDEEEYFAASLDETVMEDIMTELLRISVEGNTEVDNNAGCNYDKPVLAERNYFRSHGPKEKALLAITAMHLNGWYEKNKFCGACGQGLVHGDKERVLKCPVCGNMVYPRINPAVIVGVTRGDEILLTKYRGRSYKNYALVAGFTEIGESFEECVRREVKEEVGLEVKNISYYKSQPWGFADDILAGYFCQVDGDGDISMDAEELSLAQWVKREELDAPAEDLSLTNEMINAFRLDRVKS